MKVILNVNDSKKILNEIKDWLKNLINISYFFFLILIS